MEGLNVYAVEHEECAPGKNAVDVISVYHMLHFVVSGRGEFNGEKLSAGKAFLCRKHRHCRYCQDISDPWSYYWINADGVYADKLLSECGFDSADVIDFEMSPALSELLGVGCMSRSSEFMCGIFIAVMGLLKHSVAERVLSTSERHIRDAVDAISAAEGIISPSRLSSKLCLSRAYLRNLFVKYKNEPPREYIIRYRMTRAAELLVQTDYQISEIAASVGYDDPFQFSRIFRKLHHIPPTEYRRRMRNIQNKKDTK